ncbi:MAG: class I SAM-dependent methyltransferase [bacterium]
MSNSSRPDQTPPTNSAINKLVRSLPYETLSTLLNTNVSITNINAEAYLGWVHLLNPSILDRFGDPYQKKIIEFYVTQHLLRISPADHLLDAAGGMYSPSPYIPAARRIIQDMRLTPEFRKLHPGVEFVESDASAIPLNNESIDCISCHHSFEHFQHESDTGFVREVQRLLRSGGRACILPIFLADQYFEITDTPGVALQFDPASKTIVDVTAALPGGDVSGNYARVYDPAAFRRRVLDVVDRNEFTTTLFEIQMDGRPCPDLSRPSNRSASAINVPYRALLIEKKRR